MLRQLDYQDRVLATLDAYLTALKTEKLRADAIAKLAAAQPELGLPIPDHAAAAWETMRKTGRLPASRAEIPYSIRRDGAGNPVPNAVLKVPTGGGKTFLATQAVSRVMGQYLARNTGFVLWIVPNEAIYAQTLKRLSDRQHPYRQTLDRTAAGRVRILEKTDRLDARDVRESLCVMLLMLQSANRQTNETLRIFKDRGDVHGFTPPEGEQDKHKALIERIPNLDAYKGMFPLVMDSLGNALRIIRPVVVMDEGHKATSDLAFHTLYDFNPCFVLELTATPKDIEPRGGKNPAAGRYQNVLVEVTGKELDLEGMIKMPLNLNPRQGQDWKATLTTALHKLSELDKHAETLRAETGRYIRPIMLVQVERTGKETRDDGYIHAEDVREWLKTAGFDDAEIAVKTAETNDLSQPENQDLLSPTNQVRAIITKAALQEGWDCPFAYVLCALAAQSNLTATTQLVGRILRQPQAMKTGITALDECHVITHRAATGEVVARIKDGLERDGLGDLVVRITASDAEAAAPNVSRRIERRPAFVTTEIYLPKVLISDGPAIRDLDYEGDVLASIDWRGFDPSAIADAIPENASAAEAQLQRITLTDDDKAPIAAQSVAASVETLRFEPAYAVRMISDIVPNPFVGRDIVGAILSRLEARGFQPEQTGRLAGIIIEAMRAGLADERDSRAEAMFCDAVVNGRIQFRLRLDGQNWRMPDAIETTLPATAPPLQDANYAPVSRSLFAPVYRDDFNNEERAVAVQLDGEKALKWWHRNVARTQYGLQGWRRHRIYPDFIFAVTRADGRSRIAVLETKGDHLDNGDTDYKRKVLALLSDHFAWDRTVPAGTLALVQEAGETVACDLILMRDIPTQLPAHFR